MKFIFHVLIFVAGAGVGIWWGVNHPKAAQNLDAQVQAEVSKAKIAVYNDVIKDNPNNAANYQQKISAEQKNLTQAQQQLGNP
jgi:hypothetical protein